MRISRHKIILILVLMSISIGMLLYSFAFTTINQVGVTTNYLTVSAITFGLTDSVNSVNLGTTVPIVDKLGLDNAAFSFSITNTGSDTQNYSVRLIDSNIVSTISNDNIRYRVTIDGVVGEVKTMSLSGVIDSGTITASTTKTYSIIIWLSFDSEFTSGTWNKAVKVDAGNINIDKSGANEPLLPSNMIPVYYDKNNDEWRKADSTNSNYDYMWYDYDSRMWANAVTVSNATREMYLDSNAGEIVSIDDILSFFVWIPRYKYTLFNATSEKSLINITFEKGVRNTGTLKCTITNGIEKCSDLVNGTILAGTSTYTHPAFTFGDEELTGIWVSKFEVSSISTSPCYSNPNTSNCNVPSLDITSKPRQNSLSNTTISNYFINIRRMELNGNIHGFVNNGVTLGADGTIVNDSNNLDIHGIKEFEYASVVYMAYSKYGKFSDITYSSKEKDIFKRASLSRTGGTIVNDIEYEYNIDHYGTGGSTTGNISGIYDLMGVGTEFIMTNVLNGDGEFSTSLSGFTTVPNKVYYDCYSNRTLSKIGDGYYGDAMFEILPWLTKKNAPTAPTNPFGLRDSIFEVSSTNGGTLNGSSGRACMIVSQDVYILEW